MAAQQQALVALVQHLRSNAAAVDAKLQQLNAPGGFLTFQQLNEVLQARRSRALVCRLPVRRAAAQAAVPGLSTAGCGT